MALAGYSGTPLIKKIGIRNEVRVLLPNAPDNYFDLLKKLPSPVSCVKKKKSRV